jgi:hypothetical protein
MAMNAKTKKGKPHAVMGYLKVAGLLLLAPPMLLVWLIRGIIARWHFRAELRAAGVPKEAALRLSARYKLSLRDLPINVLNHSG